jgi:L,D-peptidoglycan transpeptidase YkuD (ErfK/YbiS/YcfS/YnhG family)
MGWCNDIYDKKNYNKLINIKDNIKYEKLFRNDYKYDLLIPIMYNTKERILNKGSAIFIHLTRNYKPTAGCVAINRKDFLILIKLINKNTKIKIF